MHIIIIEPPARADLAKAISRYDQEREGLGREFLDQLREIVMCIAENPRLYPVFHKNVRKAVLSRFPYLILYRVDETYAHVLGIMDGRQNPKTIARRAK